MDNQRGDSRKLVAGVGAVCLLLLATQSALAFSITPAQPGASTTYSLTDVYTAPGGAQWSVVLNPAGVDSLLRGGTGSFLATLQAEFPGWTFTAADSDLAGTFNILNNYACGLGTDDCATEQGIPSTIIGSFIDVTYTPGAGDPTAAGNNLHWIQRVHTNHALGAGGGHGINVDKIDNDNTVDDPVLGLCANSPYYDCGYFAGETFFVDRPSRSGDSTSEHVWGAELYLVEQTAANTVTIYNGIKWGWMNTPSDIRSFTAPPSAIVFDDPVPAVGGSTVATGIGTNNITWGTAIASSFASSLAITPTAFDLTPLIGEPFVLGTISYSNGTIIGGSGLTSVELSVQTTIDVPDLAIEGLAIDDVRTTTMINTTNTCNASVPGDCTTAEARESADYVSIPPAADLTAVPSTYPNFAELGNNFHVLEESSATATLIGRITEGEITAASGDGGGLLRPGPGAPRPGVSARRKLVIEILGFGKILEGNGFVTRGLPAQSVDDIFDPGDPGGILTGGGSVVLDFGVGSNDLTYPSALTLDRVVLLLANVSEIEIAISGHADEESDRRRAKRLATNRIRTVQEFLRLHGIDIRRLVVSDYEPADTRDEADQKAAKSPMQRGVELRIIDRRAKKKY